MAFKIIFVAVVSYWVIFELLGFVLESTNPNNGRSPYAPKIQPGTTWFEFAYLQLAMRFLSWIGTTVVLINVRTYVREKYAIPASDISGLEDCCCSCWCPCLVASQMLRHTTGTSLPRMHTSLTSHGLWVLSFATASLHGTPTGRDFWLAPASQPIEFGRMRKP